ncbi:MAG: hypothetical protein ACP6IY_03260 [Promethearchaeia archaeon]
MAILFQYIAERDKKIEQLTRELKKAHETLEKEQERAKELEQILKKYREKYRDL